MSQAETFGQQLPCSIEAEQAVLGGLMHEDGAYWRVAGQIDAGDFFRRDHSALFELIVSEVKAQRPVDQVTIMERITALGLEEVIRPDYVFELIGATFSAARITAHAEIVREKSVLRKLILAGSNIVSEGFNPDGRSSLEVLAAAQRQVEAITNQQPTRVQKLSRMADRAWQALVEASERGEQEAQGLQTGFTDLDEATGGFMPEDFIIVAARPGMGKTVLAMNIAEHVAIRRGKRAAVWSLEMSAAQLVRRLQSSVSRVPHDSLKRPWRMTDEDWEKVHKATQAFKTSGLEILDAADLSIEQLEGQAHQLHAQEPLDLMVVDYLGLMNPPKAERHELAMGEISRRCKKLAKRLGVPLIGVHQLNRGVETRQSREPTMADLRDTGRFEQDADAILLLHREQYYDESAPNDCQVHIAKNRAGPTKRIGFRARLDVCRFEDFTGSWVPYSERKRAPAAAAANEGFDDGFPPPPRQSGRDRAAGGGR
ncbi:replicative DNA helicase [Coralloluteibacterium thermophilus]|uniref:DNA 5'-3' helicase n=1 Tax=Coralloluteibacterium thermophilum TaxID=2707049 RepID=A0ABV9NJJ4_9GAMM